MRHCYLPKFWDSGDIYAMRPLDKIASHTPDVVENFSKNKSRNKLVWNIWLGENRFSKMQVVNGKKTKRNEDFEARLQELLKY